MHFLLFFMHFLILLMHFLLLLMHFLSILMHFLSILMHFLWFLMHFLSISFISFTADGYYELKVISNLPDTNYLKAYQGKETQPTMFRFSGDKCGVRLRLSSTVMSQDKQLCSFFHSFPSTQELVIFYFILCIFFINYCIFFYYFCIFYAFFSLIIAFSLLFLY